ncbi:MAG: molybdopterin-dependent oxidoreductase [Thermomicrobiales bacterium]|nr:molybdopterin-dependent oxidoreductase [Thermomicrobiales bacterium]
MTVANSARSTAPQFARKHAADPVLQITGLVDEPVQLRPADLVHLPRLPFTGSISCLERGAIPDTEWHGMPLDQLVALARPAAGARYVRVCAGPYCVPVAMEDTRGALICDSLRGEPLPVERGGPWRLIVPGSTYYAAVKWVNALEITAELPDNSAERLAESRTRARLARQRRSLDVRTPQG